MSEETFRIVVTAAALIAGLAFVVEAGILIALFWITAKMQSEIAGFAEVAEPVLSKVEALFDKIGLVIERVEPALDSIEAAAARVGAAIDRFRPVVEKAMIAVERTGVLIRGVKQVTATASPIVQDVRSRIAVSLLTFAKVFPRFWERRDSSCRQVYDSKRNHMSARAVRREQMVAFRSIS
jgi:hypothetical protein